MHAVAQGEDIHELINKWVVPLMGAKSCQNNEFFNWKALGEKTLVCDMPCSTG